MTFLKASNNFHFPVIQLLRIVCSIASWRFRDMYIITIIIIIIIIIITKLFYVFCHYVVYNNIVLGIGIGFAFCCVSVIVR